MTSAEALHAVGTTGTSRAGRARVLFLHSTLSDPRGRKRILGLAPFFGHVIVAGFTRPGAGESTLDGEVVSLGEIGYGLGVRRALIMLRSIVRVAALLRRADVVYAFGLDVLLLARLAGAVRLRKVQVLEIADIRAVETDAGWLSTIIQRVTSWLVRPVKILVSTSERYIADYYHKIIDHRFEAEFVLPNRVPGNYAKRLPLRELSGDPQIRIGYFGGIRCERSIDILTKLIARGLGKFHLVVKGEWRLDNGRRDTLRSHPDATIHGPYRSPEGLPGVYSDVDIVWVGYPYVAYRGRLVCNRRWARTTRYYEALCFGRAMIGQDGTADGKAIGTGGFGPVIPLEEPEAAARVLSRIGWPDIQTWTNAVNSRPPETESFAEEHRRLAAAVNDACGSSR